MNRRNRSVLFVVIPFLVVLFASRGFSQKTAVYSDVSSIYGSAMDLYAKEKYSAAQKEFRIVIDKIANPKDERQVNSEYYSALCALELFNKDAAFLLEGFIREHPESPRTHSAKFQLGRYYYKKRKYDKALRWFESVDSYDLSEEERIECDFKKGYGYFLEEEYDKAYSVLYNVKDKESDYKAPATYYYSHIAYTKGNYQAALEGFESLKGNKTFDLVIPYYKVQILYNQEKFDEIAAYGPELLEQAKVSREAEVSKIVGEALYQKERYDEASTYLEKYIIKSSASREDKYQLGYAQYRAKKFEKAIRTLGGIIQEEDSLTQVCYYHIADCYLQLGEKDKARNAFHSASNYDFDMEIKEDSHFNFAKLAYELSYDPFHESVTAFEEYLERYPNSAKADEAFEYLLNVYMTTKNYRAALLSLSKIEEKDIRMKTAYQRIAFNSGVSMFKINRYEEAILNFDLVKKYPIDNELIVRSLYWKAEAHYHLGKFDKAIKSFKEFKYTSGAILLDYYPYANYNIAYCHFSKKDYEAAISPFRSFVGNPKVEDKKKLADAYLRLGDCYYVKREHKKSAEYYAEAIELNQVEVDYASMQMGVSMGLLKKYDKKIEVLTNMVQNFPESKYLVNAYYELGNTCRLRERNEEALSYFEKVVTEYPEHPYSRSSKREIGLIYYKNGQTDRAVNIFKDLASTSSTYADARGALESLKQILTNESRIDEYPPFLESLSYVNLSESELDSVSYEAASNLYYDEKCEKAIDAFSKYLQKFEQGIFSVQAHFYRGECKRKLKAYEEALEDHIYVVEKPLNTFTEDALASVAWINFYILKNYESALDYYKRLVKVANNTKNIEVADYGQMICHYKLEEFESALEMANKVLDNERITKVQSVEAHLIKGNSYLFQDDKSNAMAEFKAVTAVADNEFGAEAKYNIALIQFQNGDYEKSEKEIKDFLEKFSDHYYWLGKSYILLADISAATGDYFQAKHTLLSIVENYDGEDLVAEAQKKLNELVELENQAEKKKREVVKEELNDYDKEYEELLDEEVQENDNDSIKGN